MKTLLFITLILIVSLSQAQTISSTVTVAQKALNDFKTAELSVNFDAMTTTQLATYLKTEKKLEVAVQKEINAAKVIADAELANQLAAQIAVDEARKQQIITYLKNHGFLVDNSETDWYKLYNRPVIFGDTWENQANYQISISTGIDYFINKAYELWKENQ